MAGRLQLVTSATTDGTGRLAAAFDSPPPGRVWTGAVAVPSAPAAAVMQAFIQSAAGPPLGTFIGPGSLAGVQVYGGESVIIAGTGLLPNTSYIATFYGSDQSEEEATPSMPMSAPQPGGGSSSFTFQNFIRDTGTFSSVLLPSTVLTGSDVLQLGPAMFADGATLAQAYTHFDGPSDPVAVGSFITDNGVTLAHN